MLSLPPLASYAPVLAVYFASPLVPFASSQISWFDLTVNCFCPLLLHERQG